MNEELKAGGTKEFVISGKTLVIEPIPYGALKKVFKIVTDGVQEISACKNAMRDMPKIVDKYMPVLFPLLLKRGVHDFVTPDWIDDNLTLNQMKEIVDAAIKVNGLEDFFAKQREAARGIGQLPPDTTTVSSITSSDSPTDGSPKT